jgi:hypothetical protein
MRATLATMQIRKKKHCNPMIDHCRMQRTDGIVEPVMSTDKRVRMALIRIRSKKHRKLTMDQHRMWRTGGIVLEGVKIEQYISDL